MTTNRFIKLKFDAYHFIGEGETEPIAKKLGFRNKAVFECIASHQDMNCVSDTTIDQIADLTGIGRGTVIKAVKELEDFTYEGKPILEKMQFYKGEKKKNIYKILPNHLLSCYGERLVEEEINSPKIEPLNDSNSSKNELTKEQSSKEFINKEKELEEPSMREISPKEIVTLFVDCMKKKNKEYKVVWGRDMKWAKKYLTSVEDLVNNDKKKLVEVIVENYDSWSNDGRFPFNVNTLSIEWIQDRGRKELKKEKENLSQMNEQSVEATKRTQNSLSSIMGRIKKKGGA